MRSTRISRLAPKRRIDRPGGPVGVTAVVAEKPSVARDIAAALGVEKKGDGFFYGNGYAVTWAIGHLVRLAEPHEIRPEWKRWSRAQLPMLPQDWPLIVADETRDQFEIVRRVLNDPGVKEIVCATDAGREGELIFRLIQEATGCRKPVRRLWISSLTDAAIKAGFQQLRDARTLDPLARAAKGRARADWLVGMNLSRAYTLGREELLSVGRVQTPTLAMIVERELEIRDFVPETYFEVVATFFVAPTPSGKHAHAGTWFQWDAGGGATSGAQPRCRATARRPRASCSACARRAKAPWSTSRRRARRGGCRRRCSTI